MEEERRFLPQPTVTIRLTGGLAALLGLAVLVGWYTHNTMLVQVVPTLMPMHYNAALGFLLCGIGLLALGCGRAWLAIACSLGVVMLGLLPLMEDVFDVHLGITQLPIQPSIELTPPPPRLAPNAALSFILAGTAVLVLSRSGKLEHTALIAGLLGTMVCALGLIACLGYLSGAKLAQDWGRHSAMAIHVAAGFILLGSGVMGATWQHERSQHSTAPPWLSVSVGIGGLLVTLWLWQALKAQGQELIERTVTATATGVKDEVADEMRALVLPFEYIGKEWELGDRPARAVLEANMELCRQRYPSLQAMVWVDPLLYVRWVAPPESRATMPDLFLVVEQHFSRALQQARDSREITIIHAPGLLPKSMELQIWTPLFLRTNFDGFLVGLLHAQELFDAILQHIAHGYSVTVFTGEEEIYSSAPLNRQYDTVWGQEFSMSLYGMQWRLRVSPTSALLDEKFAPLPQVVLALGCLLATLLAVTLRLAQTARLRTRQVECANQGLQNEIAERRQVEAELKALNMTLEQRVAERTAAVEARSQALARSNTDLEQFAYVASHDLQEPLRMITGYLQLLERRYKEQLGPDADTFIAYAVDGATRMQRLTQDLLAYSRVEIQGKSFAPMHCEELLERARTNLRVALAESGAVITHTSLPVVMADDVQLTQLFQNLLSNALKFCEAKPPRIHITAERQGTAWVFAICDNGIGIEPQYAERIFVIFQRLHGRASYPGTGIGLAICKKIVERHGGRIWVESTPGQGATFYFTLPA